MRPPFASADSLAHLSYLASVTVGSCCEKQRAFATETGDRLTHAGRSFPGQQIGLSKLRYWTISDPTSGVLEGNGGVVLSEELRRDVGGTRLGGIGRNRQTQGQFIGRSGGKVVELCGFPLGGTAGIVKGSWGNCKDSFACGGMARTLCYVGELQGLHYIEELWWILVESRWSMCKLN